LSKDASILFGLLHNRTFFSPVEWVQHDHQELTKSWACGNLDTSFNEQCVVVYGNRFGSLVAWNEQAAHRSEMIGFPRARLIFEKQSRLLSFLAKTVKMLLETLWRMNLCHR
jgi:hypothetical protein